MAAKVSPIRKWLDKGDQQGKPPRHRSLTPRTSGIRLGGLVRAARDEIEAVNQKLRASMQGDGSAFKGRFAFERSIDNVL